MTKLRTPLAPRPLAVLASFAAVGAVSLASAGPALADSGEPAKGAPLDQVLIGTAVAMVVTALVIWVASAHRAGRISWLGRLAGVSERVTGLPGWAALPAAVTGISLVIAVFGFYWDVAKHIDTGRDPGPFGTAAHYPILVGLFGIAIGGFMAIVLGAPRELPTSLRIRQGWYSSLGGALIFLCGAFALSGFPLDDVWHTLFGQDVTLWGPTHVLMIGGASLATLGVWVLLVEGSRALGSRGRTVLHQRRLFTHVRTAAIAGAFLLGLSTLQAEFDYGVPQFQLVYQPILIMLAAGCGLVAARIRLGRTGALQAVAFFLLARGLLTLVIGPVFGMSTLHFPLYLVEAGLVELVALVVPASRPVTLGLVSGALIGSIGLAAEWGWSHLWMPLPWPSSMLPQTAILGVCAALAGGILGGYVGRALVADKVVPERAPRWLAPAAGLLALACIGFPLPMTSGSTASASVHLKTLRTGPRRTVAVTAHVRPVTATRDAQWLTITAWQGGGLVVDRLRPLAPGTYRTTQPIPVYGKWKAFLRLANGRALRAVPIYMPADPEIPAKAIPAASRFTRPFVRDKKLLQRESVGGSAWLWGPAYALLLAIAAGWLAAITWGLRRLQGTAARARPSGRKPPPVLAGRRAIHTA